MPCIITITLTPTTVADAGQIYDYTATDRILKNIYSNKYEVFYSGQNQGKHDKELLDTIENNETIHVYYRKKPSTPFTYLGETKNYTIIQHRKTRLGCDTINENRLQIHLILKNIVNENVPVVNPKGSNGRYKKDIFVHAKIMNINGEYLKKNFKNMKNMCIGFYRYENN
jgi:hypothetical protein